jgi:hypothetical protein
VGSEKWQFLLTFRTIYADEGCVGQKKLKNMLTLYRYGPLPVFAIILDKVGQNLETVKLMEVTFFLQSGRKNALF